MTRTLDLLVAGLFDYAGMYPPASLTFQDALAEAARHGKTLQRPGLVAARMVVAPDLLPRLTDDALENAGWPLDEELTIAVTGVSLEEAAGAIRTAHAFNREAPMALVPRRIVSLEVALETALDTDEETTRDLLSGLQGARTDGLRVYVEPRWEPVVWKTAGARLFQLLNELRGEHPLGLKLRCAGPTAVTHGTMADAVAWVATTRAPLKATQGLHHPIVEAERGNKWGFLSLAAAVRLRAALGLEFDRDATVRLLSETDPGAFVLKDGLAWRDHRIGMDDMRAATESVPLHVGSCSIREPDEDLTRLFP